MRFTSDLWKKSRSKRETKEILMTMKIEKNRKKSIFISNKSVTQRERERLRDKRLSFKSEKRTIVNDSLLGGSEIRPYEVSSIESQYFHSGWEGGCYAHDKFSQSFFRKAKFSIADEFFFLMKVNRSEKWRMNFDLEEKLSIEVHILTEFPVYELNNWNYQFKDMNYHIIKEIKFKTNK